MAVAVAAIASTSAPSITWMSADTLLGHILADPLVSAEDREFFIDLLA